MERLILHWGEMGARWGINRTVAQIHALLFFSERPLAAEEIAETLGVARSNVSNSLKELQAWGIVSVVHLLGDRRDHFQSLKDVWQMFAIVLDERKRREMDPTVKVLRETSAQLAESHPQPDSHTQERLKDLLDFFETMETWYQEVHRLPLKSRVQIVRLGARLSELLR